MNKPEADNKLKPYKKIILEDKFKFSYVESNFTNVVPKDSAIILEQELDDKHKFKVKFNGAYIYTDHTIVQVEVYQYDENGKTISNSERVLSILKDGKVMPDPHPFYGSAAEKDIIKLVKPFTDIIQNLEFRKWIHSGIGKDISFNEWLIRGGHAFRGMIMGKKYGF